MAKPVSKKTTKRPPPKLVALKKGEDLPRDLVTLSDPRLLKALDIAAEKGVYQMKLRNEKRIASGSDERPFPIAYEKVGGTLRYSMQEIVEWRGGHTFANNPSRKGYVAP
jgi:hypothetical protein